MTQNEDFQPVTKISIISAVVALAFIALVLAIWPTSGAQTAAAAQAQPTQTLAQMTAEPVAEPRAQAQIAAQPSQLAAPALAAPAGTTDIPQAISARPAASEPVQRNGAGTSIPTTDELLPATNPVPFDAWATPADQAEAAQYRAEHPIACADYAMLTAEDGTCVTSDFYADQTFRTDPESNPAEVIQEDDPRWDCATMGNRICGPQPLN
ncbi:hypothetical protein [Longimicrobium sp.]|jgi:hypothetical protein|uniref:hypothetical protein n=1 Tax=Longimicrobium sp. TaxID=2029185 RepID=UPI002ED799D9